MGLELARLREDTPGCAKVVHLNNAGSALPTRQTLQASIDHLLLEARVGGYEAAELRAQELKAVSMALGRLLEVDPLDISLCQSDTAAWTKAFWGLAHSDWFGRGARVLVDRAVYNSHYFSLLQASRLLGLEVEEIESNQDGTIDLEDLDRRLDSSVRLVTATHVGTHRGLINPVEEVGQRTKQLGIPFLLDACQSAGQLTVSIPRIQCDCATGTGRKFLRGPRGTGWLYVSPEWSERMNPPGVDSFSADWTEPHGFRLRPRAQRFDEFETSYAARLGLGVAVEYALELGIEAIRERIDLLAESLRHDLEGVGAAVHDGGRLRSALVTFTVPGLSPEQVKLSLAQERINVTVTNTLSNHLDMEQRGIGSAVRASPHAYNSEEEIAALVGHVERLLRSGGS